jgi:hypothetical protein
MTDYLICPYCHRPVLHPQTEHHGHCDTGVSAYLVHGSYGCDTGCCGHRAYLLDAKDDIVDSHFVFAHWSAMDGPKDAFVKEIIHSRWPWVSIHYDRCEAIDD